MQCQRCKEQTATIHLTEINNGERQETHLCEVCADQEGLAIKSQIPLNELLSTLLASQSSGKEQPVAETAATAKDEDSCPSCGMTMQEFQKGHLLGCANDYDVFGDTLEPIIAKNQGGNTVHKGKVPENAPEDSKKQIEILNLRRELEDAVENEDYENAAKIRDRIEHLQ
jgi:protein arginine kinase activator